MLSQPDYKDTCVRVGCGSIVETESQGFCSKWQFSINTSWTTGHGLPWDVCHVERRCRQCPSWSFWGHLEGMSRSEDWWWPASVVGPPSLAKSRVVLPTLFIETPQGLHLSREPFFPKVHSFSNIIGTESAQVLKSRNPQRGLFRHLSNRQCTGHWTSNY